MTSSEFPQGTNLLNNPIHRRDFLKTMAASLAMVGVSSCAVVRRPKKHLYPYTIPPEHVIPGEALYYATTHVFGEEAYGLLVETHEGRPTKIEGNPLHPTNLGKTSVFHQASILDLYDPDRPQNVLYQQKTSSHKKWKVHLQSLRKKLTVNQGKRFCILSERLPSPTHYRLLNAFKTKYPLSEIYLYNPVHFDNVYQGLKQATSQLCLPKVNFQKASVIVSLNADFLSEKEPFYMQNTRDFVKRRNPHHSKGMNRLYQFESHYTITGAKADHRFVVQPSHIEIVLYKLMSELYDAGLLIKVNHEFVTLAKEILGHCEKVLSTSIKVSIRSVTQDLLHHKNNSIIVAGASEIPMVHTMVYFLNMWLDNHQNTVTYPTSYFTNEPFFQKNNSQSIREFASKLNKNAFDNVLILGGDPLYNAPADLNLMRLLKKVETIHVSHLVNQTSQMSTWVLPRSHYLEAWSDATSLEGTHSLVQPLIKPLYKSTCFIQLLSDFLTDSPRSSFQILRQTWQSLSQPTWKHALHQGLIHTTHNPLKTFSSLPVKQLLKSLLERKKILVSRKMNALEIAIYSDYKVYDGSFVNNGWLQEMPDPITKVTWDNAILISHATAQKYKLNQNDIIRIRSPKSQSIVIEGPIYILPGHADNVISLFLGYGQQQLKGKIGNNVGYNAYRFLTTYQEEPYIIGGSIDSIHQSYPLASVQEHWQIDKPSGSSQNDRPIYLETDLKTYQKDVLFAKKTSAVPSLPENHERREKHQLRHPIYGDQMSIYPQRTYDTGYQWGMNIDLSKCIGCNACMIACQSENNIPIVGKERVMEGREMHWIRLDRYFEGNAHNPRMLIQPVTCLHCENAPCEQVCPVAATTHSEEGTNDMAYNRCIGTRFCSNNCPVKVRRFNFLDYHQRHPHSKKRVRRHLFDLIREPAESIQMQFNPNVTVRMRGVMEKCTYCIQRISKTKIKAKLQNRNVRDKEIQTACEQSCPAGAIVFGNINDPNSRVAIVQKDNRNYHLLPELNLKPRTTYTANIRNTNPKIKV